MLRYVRFSTIPPRSTALFSRIPLVVWSMVRPSTKIKLSPPVVSLPIDLLRNDLLLTLQPVPAETIVSIVDDAFLPLARVSSGLTGG